MKRELLPLSLLCISFGIHAQDRQKPELPNVIFIYADDLGKGMLSKYGQQHFSTPHIDRLFNEGVAFEQAYGCMLSAPARASLLTGYHDCRQDKWNINPGALFVNTDREEDIVSVESQIDATHVLLDAKDLYLPQVFREAGYVTAEIGKLEWGFTASRNQMKAHGWDYYYGYLDHVRCHGFYPPYLFENGSIVRIEGNFRKDCGKSIEGETPETYAERWDMTGKKTYSQTLFLEKILGFIRANQHRPFFLYHPTQLPHGPVAIPQIDPEIAGNPHLTPIEKEYASMVKMLDDHVGVIMNELRTLGLEENTIVVFSSDNGHEIYYSQKGRCEKPYRDLQADRPFDDLTHKYYSVLGGDVFNGNAGMAGLKRSNLEGGVNVPLTFYWKGTLNPATHREVVAGYDLIPTFADLLSVELKSEKDGISYWPVVARRQKLPEKRYIVFGSNYGPAIVMNDGWKLRYYRKDELFELYNLHADPRETTDLSAEYPEKTEELKMLLLQECEGDLGNGVNRAG